MPYRLGIDVGTNSLGWAIVQLSDELEPRQLVDLGVRIFSDARNPNKDKPSNAAQRRIPRGARRNRDRRLKRKARLMAALTGIGLMPGDQAGRKTVEKQDPWILRCQALDHKLEPQQIGRALFHLQQRRGFKSNRKTDPGDKGSGKVHEAIKRTRAKLAAAGARTLGEYFGRRRLEQQQINRGQAEGEPQPLPLARVRSRGKGAGATYDYYPQRDMILHEFDLIWEAQAGHHPGIMTPDTKADIREIFAWQRPLRPQQVGKCSFIEGEIRAPKALPSFQRFRILQEVNNLAVGAIGETPRDLSPEERRMVTEFLAVPTSKTARREFNTIRETLGLPESQIFNLESPKRPYLTGGKTAAKLMQADAWGKDWFELELAEQDRIVTRLLEQEREDRLKTWLQDTYARAELCAQTLSALALPEGHAKLSARAIYKLLPLMETGVKYKDAVRQVFGRPPDQRNGVIHEQLPYYGEVLHRRHTAYETDNPQNDEERWGRVANPTVHVALNQLRKLVNDLMQHYGSPTQIVVELARDLPLSGHARNALERKQTQNRKKNETIRAKLQELGENPDSYDNRLKWRLYEELPALRKQCVFSGQQISETALFTDNIQIEHILPFARTLDDSFANKVLATRGANADKRDRSPYEAFGYSPDGYDWEAICRRAKDLPVKNWRFQPEAMARFDDEAGFRARQLNDTRYIARLARTFLAAIYGGQGAPGQRNSVWVVPGRLTADLRHYAGLNGLLSDDNRKDRTDHRHHAIDAFVVALTDRAMVKRAADLARREDEIAHYKIMKAMTMKAMAKPLRRYRRSVADRLDKLTVSHKPDHGFQHSMLNETAYGLTGDRDEQGNALLVRRKNLDSLKVTDLETIRDAQLRAFFRQETEGLDGRDFVAALTQAGQSLTPPVYRVRVLPKKSVKDTSFITVRHGNGYEKACKTDSNYCYDIWIDDKDKWTGEVITTFQAYQRAQQDPQWWCKPGGPGGQALIMRIRKGDMLEINGANGGRQKVIVYKFSKDRIFIAEHYQANVSKRIKVGGLKCIEKAPTGLQKAGAVKITVSPCGKVSRHKQQRA